MQFRKLLQFSVLGVMLSGVTPVSAQAPDPAQQNAQQGTTPVIHVDVVDYVQRSTKAVNYQNRGATKIDFEGTPLLPKANGEAKVETKKGYTEIEVEFDDLKPATQFGPEYLTYVLWAVTPEGRASNLGELILSGNRGKLNVTTELPTFSMLVTAEPYFGVTQPSDVVVMENIVRGDTVGNVQTVDTKYELLKKGTYTKNIDTSTFAPVTPSSKMPLDLLQAQNAIRLAKASGADQYAAQSISKAEADYSEAQKYVAKNSTRKLALTSARQAVQSAEDARLISIQKQEEARAAAERQAQEQQVADAALAAAEASRRAKAEEAARREAELAKQNAQADAARATAEANRAAAARATAEAEQARAQAEQARAEAAQAQALAARQQAERQAQQSREAAEKAEADRVAMRQRLQQQLNAVLETKETDHGLVANMSDVLFDTGKSTLKPEAREKLAKVSVILVAHPDLKLEIDGHTDSQGSDATNQKLSESRAAAARDYLVSQGLSSDSIVVKGYGESNPIASNDNAKGRAQNRRVEIVISGGPIDAPGQAAPDAERKLPPLK
jgi:outer membrane protein OmpA-like peptidoglycan-associated protein